MSIAAKHFDPILGIDVHIILIPTPAGPVPTPLPNPYVGMAMDPFDYAPLIGGTVYVNGMMRAQAGTGGVATVPHIPMGGPFGPPPPTNESEVFMGSMTVASDGDAQSYFGLPVLSCSSIGMPPPFRPKGQPPKCLVLPTSAILSIPAGRPVLVGGAPTISLMTLAFKGVFAGLGALGRAVRRAQRGAGRFGRMMRAASRRANAAGDALADAMRLGARGRQRLRNAVCSVTGHPVDVATGRIFTERIDFDLNGPLPFSFKRCWSSASNHAGTIGHGWHHPYDQALHVRDDVVLLRDGEGRLVAFPPVAQGETWKDRRERVQLTRRGHQYTLRDRDGLQHIFEAVGRPNGEHVLKRIEDARGNLIRIEHDASGNQTCINDSCGRCLDITTDSAGRWTALHGPDPDRTGRRICLLQFAYDDAGNLTSVTDALGHSETYAYHDHLLVAETDRNALTFSFEYDGAGPTARCVRTWGTDGIYHHRLEYRDDAGVTEVTDSLGHTTLYRHDGVLVTAARDPVGNVSTAEYSEEHFLLEQVDALGRRLAYTYDAAGNLTEVSYPGGTSESMTYDERDRLLTATDRCGQTWLWQYDSRGNIVLETDPAGEVTQLEWSSQGLVRSVSPTGAEQRLSYGPDGLLAEEVDAIGTVTRYQHDGLGRVTQIRDDQGNFEKMIRDLKGQIVRRDAADGAWEENRWDPEGNLLSTKHTHGEVAFGYQGMGRLAWRREGSTEITLRYDTEEQLVEIKNEAGSTYAFDYSPAGYVLSERNFDGSVRSFKRDPEGNALVTTHPSGRTSRFTYDPAGHLAEVAYDDETVERFTYRGDGLLVACENRDHKIVFHRDTLGRIVREEQDDHWVQSVYQGQRDDDRIRVETSMGAAIDYRLDVAGHMTGIEASDQHGSVFSCQVTRDANGLATQRVFSGGIEERWTRDSQGRPLRTDVHDGFGPRRAVLYQWREDDRIRRLDDLDHGPTHFQHDPIGNLRAAFDRRGRQLRVADAVGNLFRSENVNDREYGPAGNVKVVRDAAGTTRYTYDADGNRIGKCDPEGLTWRYDYDGAGRLIAVHRPDGSVVRMTYDPLGRRRSRTWRGKRTCWLWDGHVPIHEWVEHLEQPDALEQVPRHEEPLHHKSPRPNRGTAAPRGPPLPSRVAPITWIFEPGEFSPSGRMASGHSHAVVRDHIGTPLMMFDDSGGLVWRGTTDIWGGTWQDGGTVHCPFRWPGQYADAETGLCYNRHRYYDPQTGQYTSPDPIKLGAGLAQYAYVHDPLVLFDPLGLLPYKGFFAKRNEYAQGRNPGRSRQRIPYQGSRGRDFTLANRQAGFSRTPAGYTWHHVDYNPRTGHGTMQLVRTDVHDAHRHRGGVSRFRAATGLAYDTPDAVRHVESKGRLRGRPCR